MKKPIIVLGLGFGDEGKGSMVDYLARKHDAKLVVRFNGGAQARHHVVTPEGVSHGFSQFGSGTFAGADTLLSRHHLFDPLELIAEAKALTDKGVERPLGRVFVDENALVVTSLHVIANRVRELVRAASPDGRHGSCGMGIWETQEAADHLKTNALRAGDLLNKNVTEAKLHALRDYLVDSVSSFIEKYRDRAQRPEEYEAYLQRLTGKREVYAWMEAVYPTIADLHITSGTLKLSSALRSQRQVIFEGAQGVLLDRHIGFTPYTTGSITTEQKALDLIEEAAASPLNVNVVGVTRAYMVRHGPGPMPSEQQGMQAPEHHNKFGEWQRSLRYGHLDFLMLSYALRACIGVDSLAVTCLDHVGPLVQVCDGYYLQDLATTLPAPSRHGAVILTAGLAGVRTIRTASLGVSELPQWLHDKLGVPVRYLSRGPTWKEKEAL